MNNYYQRSAPCYSFGRKIKENGRANELGPGQYNWTSGKDKTMRAEARPVFGKAKNQDRAYLKQNEM